MEERITAQLGHKPQGSFTIKRVCPWGYPVVLQTHPYMGSISPTLYWLSCPYLVKAISRLEADGLVGVYDQRLLEDSTFRKALEDAHEDYAKERRTFIKSDAKLAEKVLKKLRESGIGGSENREGTKCLHMHLAHFLATGKNPIGEEVWGRITPWHEDACPINCPPVPSNYPKPMAVIDAGSNTCRLLIAGVYPKPLREPLLAGSNEGYLHAIRTHIITTEAGRDIEKGRELTFEAVEKYLELIDSAGAKLVKGVATGIWRKIGSPHSSLAVITGDQEAQYSFLGACSSLQLIGKATVCDLGGGSLELITGQDGSICERKSFELGFWSVAKALNIKGSKLSLEEASRINGYVKDSIKNITIEGSLVLIGGTATTFAGVDLGLKEYDSNRIHGHSLNIYGELPLTLPDWAKERESSIAIGVEILRAIAEIAKQSHAVVSDVGLMGGVLARVSKK